MNKSELKRVLFSLSSCEDRLLKIRSKFADTEDYQFECNGVDSTELSLYALIDAAVAALDEICEKCEFDDYLLIPIERDC